MRKLIFVSLSILLLACGSKFSSTQVSSGGTSIIGGSTIYNRSTQAERSIVLLNLIDKNNIRLGRCSGALIGPQTVLTAAHCLMHGIVKVEVVLGDYNTTDPNLIRTATRFAAHPDFNSIPYKTYEWKLNSKNQYDKVDAYIPGKNFDHDFGVIVFDGGPIPGSAWLEIDHDKKHDYSGEEVVIYGYGRTADYGDEATATQALLGDLKKGTFEIDKGFGDSDYMYWATGVDNTFSCQGDSGGPQVYEHKGKFKIVGLNSCSSGNYAPDKAQSCKGKNKSARIAPSADWIESTAQALLN